jgi:beta-lactamase regulating signal transducer with metallopeptidase domain
MHAAAWMEALASVAVRCAWESLLIAGFLAAVLRRIPGLSPRAAFRAWGAGFALAALLPWCPEGPRARLERCFTDIFELVHEHGASAVQGTQSPTPALQVSPGHAPLLHLSSGWAEGVCLLWAAAATVALLRLAVGVWSLRRLVRGALLAPQAVQILYLQLVQEDGRVSRRARGARLLVADELSAPSACGLFGACILLPSELVETLSEEELECVLRHEAAHLCRRDDWWTIAARLVRALMPVAIGLTWLDRQMARAREMACDDAALRRGAARTGNPARYAACLARLADKPATQPWRGLAPGLTHGLGADGSQLAARVGYILRSGEALVRPGPLRLATAAVVCVGMASALLAAPAVLTFSSAGRPPHMASGPMPARIAKRASAMLAAPKMRPEVFPVHRHPRSAARRRTDAPAHISTALRDEAVARLQPRSEQTKVRLQAADAPLKHVRRARQALFEFPQSLLPPPQAVLLFWSGTEDWDGGNLVLLFANPDGRTASGGTRIVLLNI